MKFQRPKIQIASPVKIMLAYLASIFIFAGIYSYWGKSDFRVDTSTVDEVFETNKMQTFLDVSRKLFLKFKVTEENKILKIYPYNEISLPELGRLKFFRVRNIRYEKENEDELLNFTMTYYFSDFKKPINETMSLYLPGIDTDKLTLSPQSTFENAEYSILSRLYKLERENFHPTLKYRDPRHHTYDESGNDYLIKEEFSLDNFPSVDEFLSIIDPKGAHYWRMVYFSAVTISTIGYGDILPISHWSRFWVTVESFLGVVLLGMFASSLYDTMTRKKRLKQERQRTRKDMVDLPKFSYEDVMVIRHTLKMDRDKFAKMIGVSVEDLDKIEKNQLPPSPETSRRLHIIQEILLLG